MYAVSRKEPAGTGRMAQDQTICCKSAAQPFPTGAVTQTGPIFQDENKHT